MEIKSSNKMMTGIKKVKKRNGKLEDFDVNKINVFVERCCEGLDNVSASEVVLDMETSFYNKITTEEIDKSIELTAKEKVYKEPNYSYVAANVVLSSLYKEVLKESVDADTFEEDYRSVFVKNIKKGVKNGIYSENLLKYDLRDLSKYLKIERDQLFKYFGIRNICDRYLARYNEKIIETPQAFYMRVAMGLCFNEDDPQKRVKQLYDVYSKHLASASTPTLFNSGMINNQLSSCYLSEIHDSVDGIFDGLWQEARKSKYAGGLGFHVSKIRASGSHIKGTNGTSSGLIPWLKVYNSMLIACNQAGKRQGSGCAYLEPWHYDIYDFIDLRKATGEERRRCHDLNTALWTCDLFMKRVENEEHWSLFCPSETSDLTDLYGTEFEKRYCEYESMGESGELKIYRRVNAKEMWKKMLRSLFETSHPWVTFKDNFNIRYTNSHEGALHGSNLCCVTGDQRVPTQFGILTVKELAENYKDQPLSVVGRTSIESASHMQKTLKDVPILKIKTKNGYEHKVTYDHPLWVVDKGWVEAQDLKIGDKVEVQQIEGLWGSDNFEDAAYIMGLVAGDGTFLKYKSTESVCIDIWEKDFDKVDKIQNIVYRLLDKHVGIDFEFNTTALKHPIFRDQNTGQSEVKKKRLVSAPLAKILSKYGFNSKTKTDIPVSLWSADKKTISSYFSGRFIADGTCQVNSKQTSSSLASNNLKFIQDAQILLSNFGIKSHINKMGGSGKSILPDGKGGNKEYDVRDCYRLCISSKKSNSILDENTSFFKDRGILIESCRSDNFYDVKNHTVIDSIERCGNEDTYCLNVLSNDDHAWTCNGLITKNTEIGLHTKHSEYKDGKKIKVGETAVCNLSSVNLAKHVTNGKIDFNKLKNTISVISRALDNVIDINFYPTEEARNSNLKHRPVGMGTMGWSDVYNLLKIPQDSDEGIELADSLMEFISLHAIYNSSLLAKERGKYPTYSGSKWDNNLFPIDTYNQLMEFKGKDEYKSSETLEEWKMVRDHVKQHGMRNSNVMAIAPNASIAYQLGCEQSIEPTYENMFRYENKSGNNYIINFHFVNDLKKLGIWNYEFAELMKQTDGSISDIEDIPKKIKDLYKNAFERDMFKLVEATARRQKWIDQAISFNIYNAFTSLSYLHKIYMMCYLRGVKSTYYLRNKAASKIQKVTVESNDVVKTEEEKLKEFSEKLEAAKKAAQNGEQCEMCEG